MDQSSSPFFGAVWISRGLPDIREWVLEFVGLFSKHVDHGNWIHIPVITAYWVSYKYLTKLH